MTPESAQKKTAIASNRMEEASDWHQADIIAAVKKAGWSLRALSIRHGYAPGTLRNALRTPYPNGEKLIADAIGCKPEVIWPSRYKTRNFTPVLARGHIGASVRTEQTVPAVG
ncbi:helix-turn-helix domain-containing protein [Burkholderia glumae]|uniref:helix-turn-helix domain-containing protein n=1 Tax=Burkholderia glumae TaxID=337 RepID=UPI00214FC193|nr:helix-turn-helix domain-containing protein [Burkholderia glumae]